MTAAEVGILLLCTDLGRQGARPLTEPQFRALSRLVQSGRREGEDLNSALSAGHLTRLGCSDGEARRIMELLNRGEQLNRYLEAGSEYGIFPLTCRSPGYPAQLLQKSGVVPPVFFCAGNLELLRGPFVGLAGSRRLGPAGEAFAARVGELAAEEGFVLVTGGARGADWAALRVCLECGGKTIMFVPDELCRRVRDAGPNCLMLSADGYNLPFTAARALTRNAWVHKMGNSTLIPQTGIGRGGTWRGSVENLRMGWSALYVYDDGSPGALALAEMGATLLRRLDTIAGLVPSQRTFFQAF